MAKRVVLDKPQDGDVWGVSWVDSAIVEDIQRMYPNWNTTKYGMRVDDLSVFWPFAPLRELLVQHCKMFIDQEERAHGLIRLTNETDFKVWGPLRHRNPSTGLVRQEHNVQDGKIVQVPRSFGFHENEWADPNLVDFRFCGRFVAKTGFISEEPKQIAS